MTDNAISLVQWHPSNIDPTTVIPRIIDLHISCIQHDNSMMRFHPPFDAPKRAQMQTFWETRFAAAAKDEIVIILVCSSPTTTPKPQNTKEDQTLSGIGAVTLPTTDTRPFGAGIELLMVSPLHQRQGIATKVMEELERVAKQRGRTLIRLGTTKDSPADLYLYPRLGYVKIGEVPRYGYEPNTMRLRDAVEYYKHLV